MSIHSRYLQRYFGAAIVRSLSEDELYAILNTPAESGDVCPTDTRCINTQRGYAVFGAPAAYGGEAQGYAIATDNSIVADCGHGLSPERDRPPCANCDRCITCCPCPGGYWD